MASPLLRQAVAKGAAQAPIYPQWTPEEIQRYERDCIMMEREIAEEVEEERTTNWQEAAWAALYAPPPLCPVVLGGRSLFKCPEDVSSFLGTLEHYSTSAVPVLDADLCIELYRNPDTAAEKISSDPYLPNVVVCEVNIGIREDLRDVTKGEDVLVLLHGATKLAWLPTALGELCQIPNSTTSELESHAPADGQFPVLIGNVGGHSSMFETTKDLRDFLDLSEIPALVQTTATSVNWKPGKRRPLHDSWPSMHVAFVNADQLRELYSRTEGMDLLLWFPNNIPRYAWAPHYTVVDDESVDEREDATEQDAQETSSTAANTLVFGNEASTSSDFADLEKQNERDGVKSASLTSALWNWVAGVYLKITKPGH